MSKGTNLGARPTQRAAASNITRSFHYITMRQRTRAHGSVKGNQSVACSDKSASCGRSEQAAYSLGARDLVRYHTFFPLYHNETKNQSTGRSGKGNQSEACSDKSASCGRSEQAVGGLGARDLVRGALGSDITHEENFP